MRRWRRWSPWRLRSELRFLRSLASDEVLMWNDNRMNTVMERFWRHTHYTLEGDPDPWGRARRYRVEGRSLCIDATPDGNAGYRQTPTAKDAS